MMMIRIFRKSWRRSKRTVCVALSLVLILSLTAAPVGAAELSGHSTFVVTGRDSDTFYVGAQYPSQGNTDGSTVLGYTDASDPFYISARYFMFSFDHSLSGSLGVYYSYYFLSRSGNFEKVGSPRNGVVTYTDSTGATDNIPCSLDILTFSSPVLDGYSTTQGYVFKYRVPSIDSLVDVSRLRFTSDNLLGSYLFTPSSSTVNVSVCIPSVAFIVGDASSLDSLEGIADSIAAQSEIMSQYYGDIMSLLNDLYSRLGDMQAVQELTNTYFATLIPLVESIEGNTAQIHSLLQTQFQLLRTLIATESDDIQAAIAQQTEDLKAYFDSVFSGAVGDMPEKSDDLDSAVGDFSSAEQDYQSNASQRFDELSASFNGFTGGTLAGITLASTLFKRVWDALGEYSIVYTYPLLLGLSLVLIGRLSRTSGGQSSSEKHRGDSDA